MSLRQPPALPPLHPAERAFPPTGASGAVGATARPARNHRPAGRESRFDTVAEGDKVRFNKRVDRATADGYKILAIRARRNVPQLLAEGLAPLEERYGKV